MADAKDTFVMQDALEEYAKLDKQRLLGYTDEEEVYHNGVKDDLESEIATAQTTLNAAITQALTDAKTYANGIDLNIEEEASTYVYTFTFTKADGTVYTKKIDLPIEEFVLSASYSDGKLTISLKNGESVTVDISALISGLVNQTDFDTLTGEFNSLCEVVEGDTTKGTTGLVGEVEQLQKDVVTAQTTANGKLDQTTADTLYASKDTENTASSALTQATTNAGDIAALQTSKEDAGTAQNLINELDVSDSAQTGKYVSAVSEADGKISVTRADLPTLASLGGVDADDVDEILAEKDYAAKTDLATVEGTATEALQKANDLEKTANIGMRLCFDDEGYPCVEYLISEV